MKTIKRFLMLTAFMVVLSGLTLGVSAQSKQKTVTFQTNLRCDNCRITMEDSLPFEKGIKNIKVDVPAKMVTVIYDSSKTNPEAIKKALEKLGYEADVKDDASAATECCNAAGSSE